MSDTCVRCEALDDLESRGTWEYFASRGVTGYEGDVALVDFFFDPVPGGGWYESHPQGHEGDVWMVFKVRDKYFRKEGTSDSYGNCHWNGSFKQVNETKKTVTVYE